MGFFPTGWKIDMGLSSDEGGNRLTDVLLNSDIRFAAYLEKTYMFNQAVLNDSIQKQNSYAKTVMKFETNSFLKKVC